MTTSTTATGPRTDGAVIAIILVSYFMILLDNLIILTGLPRREAQFDPFDTALAWVQNG